MIDALGEWMTQPVYFSHYGGQPLPRTGARHPSISPYGPFNASDGAVFFGIQNEREWLVFCRAVLDQLGAGRGPPVCEQPGPGRPQRRADRDHRGRVREADGG